MFLPTVNARTIMREIVEDIIDIDNKIMPMKDFESEEFRNLWEEREELFAQREFVSSHFIF